MMRPTPKVYGPHREEDSPRTVTVFARHRDGGDHEELIPEVMLRQRRVINERAAREPADSER